MARGGGFGSDGLSNQSGGESLGLLLNIKFNPLNEISHLQTYETAVRSAATLYFKKVRVLAPGKQAYRQLAFVNESPDSQLPNFLCCPPMTISLVEVKDQLICSDFDFLSSFARHLAFQAAYSEICNIYIY